MDLLRSLDRRWRSLTRGQAAGGAVVAQEQQGAHHQPLPPPLPAAAAAGAPALGPHARDLQRSSYDQGSTSSSRASSPTEGYRPPPRAVIHAMAGYDVCDSAGSSDISRITPLRIQGIDEIEIDFEKRPPSLAKTRFTPTPLPHGKAGVEEGTAAPPIGRRSLAARCAAAASAAAGAAVRSTRDTVTGLLKKVPSGRLPTAEAPAPPPSPPPTEVSPKPGWQRRLRQTWRRHPALAVSCIVVFLVLVAAVLGVAIGLSSMGKGRLPWWAQGDGDDMWIPTGDPQLDSLLRLKTSVDHNNLLSNWTVASGRNGGFCSWDFVTCDSSGTTVEMVNLTTSTYTYVFEGHLPSGEALSGLTGLKVVDIREHHISGPLPEDWSQLPLKEIRLDQNMLEGELPPAWFGEGPLSSSLRVLTLWDNKLGGPLPETQGGMQRLQQLDLSFNAFEGPLPSSWSSMARLQQAWLNTNKLSGPLPASWGDMAALQKLVLSENGLSGALPPSWSGLRALRELWLEFNDLSGQLPKSYSSLSELRTLVLNNNNLSLSVPKSWGQLKKLQAAYLFNNPQLKGCVPPAWKARFAQDFDTSFYFLEGTGLTGFCGTSQSEQLPPPAESKADTPADTPPPTPEPSSDAQPLPEEPQQQQPTLPEQPQPPQEEQEPEKEEEEEKEEEPAATKPTPPTTQPAQRPPPPSKGQRPSVPVRPKPAPPSPDNPTPTPTPAAPAPAPTPAMTPEPPTPEGQLAALLALKAAVDTRGVLDGSWSRSKPDFCTWPLVECDAAGVVRTLNLTTNEYESTLSGTLPTGARVFSGLPGLRRLDIRMHNIGGTLPADWGSGYMPSIEVIRLDQNKLTGWLPSGWAGLGGSLRELSLSQNKLTGPLPLSWGQGLSGIQQLDLSFNSLGGSLPASWGAWTGVQGIQLQANRLTGPLPGLWAGMSALQMLVLSENGLRGTLPASWAEMGSLRELWLEYNQLSGPLPGAWSALGGHLERLVLNDNRLTGSVPRSWAKFRDVAPGPMVLHVFNNPGLTGCLPLGLKQQLQYDIDLYVHQGTAIRGYCPS